MSRPSPRSRRPGRPRPGSSTMITHEAGLEVLKGDYPEAVKTRTFLACRGALHGSRQCLLCGGQGATTRVYVPPEALRVDRPDYRGIAAYWLCMTHRELTTADPQVSEALKHRGTRR
jgi:hypothetical protein